MWTWLTVRFLKAASFCAGRVENRFFAVHFAQCDSKEAEQRLVRKLIAQMALGSGLIEFEEQKEEVAQA
jgi:hypothetical protein